MTREDGRVPEPGILSIAVALYAMAIGVVFLRGNESFLSALLAGGGSITTGVWIGLIISHRRGYTHTHDEEEHLY